MDAALEDIAALLRLEQSVRAAQTPVEASWLVVNETRTLSSYAQAVLLLGRPHSALRVNRLSNLSDVDRTAPFVTWMERLARHVERQPNANEAHAITPDALPPALREDWASLAPPHLLWLPMVAGWRGRQGVLVLGRDRPWQPQELGLLTHLAGGYAASLAALTPRLRGVWRTRPLRWALSAVAAAAIAGVMTLPMRLSVLAPAEVTAQQAYAVTAPLDGVVSRVRVVPNQPVDAGMVLADMEATDLQGAQDVSRRALRVAEAELHRVRQAAFLDPRSKADVAQLQAQVDLKRKEMEFAQTRLGNASLRADRKGVAVLDDPQAWTGRPVRVGEMILRIADPAQVEVTVMVPVKDAIALEAGREVKLFLDTAPMTPLEATVTRASYEPVTAATGGAPSYRVTAALRAGASGATGATGAAADAPPRIGLRGTAKIYGEESTLFYVLFRRPVTALRQWVGW